MRSMPSTKRPWSSPNGAHGGRPLMHGSFFCRANEDRAEMEHVLDAAICQQQVAYKGALHQQLKCYVVFLNAQILAHIQEFD